MMPRMPRSVSDMKSNGASIREPPEVGGAKAQRGQALHGRADRARIRCGLAPGPPCPSACRACDHRRGRQDAQVEQVVVAERGHTQRRQQRQPLQFRKDARQYLRMDQSAGSSMKAS